MQIDEKLADIRVRAQVAVLLSQVQTTQAQMLDLVGAVHAASSNAGLTLALTKLAGAELQLCLALEAPANSLRGYDLAALTSLVQGVTTAATSAALAAQSDAGTAQQNLADASIATRNQVAGLSHDLFQQRIFEPYLRFASQADEEEYRRRAAAREQEIQALLARKTPEGDLLAGAVTADQMLDAHAYGAGACPEFLRRWDSLTEVLHRQRAAMLREGKSTEEFDRRIHDIARDFLKKQHLSDAEADAALSAKSPLDVVRYYLRDGDQAFVLAKRLSRSAVAPPGSAPSTTVEAAADAHRESPVDLNVADAAKLVASKLQAAGVLTPEVPSSATGHGLSATAKGPDATPALPG